VLYGPLLWHWVDGWVSKSISIQHEYFSHGILGIPLAFKLVWVPTEDFDTFVLVDDDGEELARGYPHGNLPGMDQRQLNYLMVEGSKYAKVADVIAPRELVE